MALKLGFVRVGLLVLAVAAPALAADPVINDEARAHFTAGVSLLQDPDGARYEEAYREFKVAYAASPSWKILGNLGLCAMKLERDGEAIAAYTKYLKEGGKQVDAEERAQSQRDLATLEVGVVRVTLQSEPPGATIEDERFPAIGSAIRNSYGPLNAPAQLGVRAGRHRFTARLPGRPEAVWDVELSPRQTEAYTFKLPEPSSPSSPGASPSPAPPLAAGPSTSGTATVDAGTAPNVSGMRIGSYVALGVGVVGVGVGTLFGLSAKSKYAEANDLADANCPTSGPCYLPPTLFDKRVQLGKDGDSNKTLSLVGFVVGGVGLATGVTLFVLSSGKKEQPTAATVSPYLGIGSLGVRGSF